MLILTAMWRKIFLMAKQVRHFDIPLDPQILADPKHELVKTLIYIYSMESFVFTEMNRTSRMKVVDNIKYYGAFASALGFAIHCGNKKDTSQKREFTSYRGFQLPDKELKEKFIENTNISLSGFTSTTLNI